MFVIKEVEKLKRTKQKPDKCSSVIWGAMGTY